MGKLWCEVGPDELDPTNHFLESNKRHLLTVCPAVPSKTYGQLSLEFLRGKYAEMGDEEKSESPRVLARIAALETLLKT
jgi:hypothetical protein